MDKNTAKTWAAGLIVAALVAHAVWREAYPPSALPSGESENLVRLRSWVRSSADLATRRLWALDREQQATGSALAAVREDLGAAMREQLELSESARAGQAARLESLEAELGALEHRLRATRDSLSLWLAAETATLVQRQSRLQKDAQESALALAGLQSALAGLQQDLAGQQDASTLTVRLDALAVALEGFQAQQAELAESWHAELADLREAAGLRVEELGRQLASLEQSWTDALNTRLEQFEPGFRHALEASAPGVYRLVLRGASGEQVLGTAFAVRADGVLATAGSVALEAQRLTFHEPGSVLEVEPCAGGARLPVLRQRIVEGMRSGEAAQDAALLKVDGLGSPLQVLGLGGRRPTLAGPVGVIFPQPGELVFVRGYAAHSDDSSLRFRAELPPGVAGAPIVTPEGWVVAVHSGLSADGFLASAAWSAAWAELLQDF